MVKLIVGIVSFLILMKLLRPLSYGSYDEQKIWREKISPKGEKIALMFGTVMSTLCGLAAYFEIQYVEANCQPPELVCMLMSLVPFFICGAINSGVVHSHMTREDKNQENVKNLASANIVLILFVWFWYFLCMGNNAVATPIFTLLVGKFIWLDISCKDLMAQVKTLLNTLKLQGCWYTFIMALAVLGCLLFADRLPNLFSLVSYGLIGGMIAAIIALCIIKIIQDINRKVKS